MNIFQKKNLIKIDFLRHLSKVVYQIFISVMNRGKQNRETYGAMLKYVTRLVELQIY